MIDDVLKTLLRAALSESLQENRGVIRAECEAAVRQAAPSPAVLTTAEAAKLAGVKPRTIQKWVREGRLKALGGRPYRFNPADVERARDRLAIANSVLSLEERANDILARRKRGEAP